VNSPFDTNVPAGAVISIQVHPHVVLEFAWCPPGTFLMGSSNTDDIGDSSERPQHEVTFPIGFWLGQAPVTQEQWIMIMDQKPKLFRKGVSLPAEMVWSQADEFCHVLNQLSQEMRPTARETLTFELPTEQHWEYACRAGTTSRWFFGDDKAELSEYAWYNDNSVGEKHTIRMKRPNPWNLYDLYGNVAEWCRNPAYSYKRGPSANTSSTQSDGGKDRLMIVRGGNCDDLAINCRSASRRPMLENNPFNERVGVRVLCKVDLSSLRLDQQK
jgi:formylglycine-generating enzyme required for sulfatase activity